MSHDRSLRRAAVIINGSQLQTANASFLGANAIVNTLDTFGSGYVWFQNNATGTYSGNMSGNGTVYVGYNGGTAVTTFSGTNTSTGDTNLFGLGTTLRLIGGAALADTSAVYISGGATLDVAAAETIGALNSNGNVTLSGGNLTINSATPTTTGTFSGVISGSNGLTKIGTGTQTLSGANTFTGGTTVTNGKLILSGGAALADTGAVVVNSTATTSGRGRLPPGTPGTCKGARA